jgi:hypothetical protein
MTMIKFALSYLRGDVIWCAHRAVHPRVLHVMPGKPCGGKSTPHTRQHTPRQAL